MHLQLPSPEPAMLGIHFQADSGNQFCIKLKPLGQSITCSFSFREGSGEGHFLSRGQLRRTLVRDKCVSARGISTIYHNML